MVQRQSTRRPIGLLAAGLACVFASCGLEPKPTTGEPRVDDTAPIRTHNPFEPESIRVHPLTRIGTDPESGKPQVEVFIELLDRWNHGVKALGIVVLELYEAGGPASATRGGPQQIQLWKVDLSDPDRNAGPYDRVTRTYHLSLADVPPGLPAERDLELRVRFTTQSGHQISATHRFGKR